MKEQIAELWADAVGWMKTHPAITALSGIVLLLALILAIR